MNEFWPPSNPYLRLTPEKSKGFARFNIVAGALTLSSPLSFPLEGEHHN
jgi:hypothetical protein